MTDRPIVPLAKDPRAIQSIAQGLKEGDWRWIVGVNGVTEIRVYEEPGDGAMVPWFAVYVGEHIDVRIAAKNLIVAYMPPKETMQ